jgi:hypothetical protein
MLCKQSHMGTLKSLEQFDHYILKLLIELLGTLQQQIKTQAPIHIRSACF